MLLTCRFLARVCKDFPSALPSPDVTCGEISDKRHETGLTDKRYSPVNDHVTLVVSLPTLAPRLVWRERRPRWLFACRQCFKAASVVGERVVVVACLSVAGRIEKLLAGRQGVEAASVMGERVVGAGVPDPREKEVSDGTAREARPPFISSHSPPAAQEA